MSRTHGRSVVRREKALLSGNRGGSCSGAEERTLLPSSCCLLAGEGREEPGMHSCPGNTPVAGRAAQRSQATRWYPLRPQLAKGKVKPLLSGMLWRAWRREPPLSPPALPGSLPPPPLSPSPSTPKACCCPGRSQKPPGTSGHRGKAKVTR